MTTIRALGLLSGGLDSTLAARVLLDQGIDVVGLHLESPTACRSQAGEVARELGITLHVRPKGEEYLRLLRHPRFGYGRNMNPCIDCRMFMLGLGQDYLEEHGAQFLFTGEVVGQRPMSQTERSLALIDRASGLEGRVVRPLSARLLPETEPERRGWIDRARLLGISGRSREVQLRMARDLGLTVFQSPGGGCLLTDASFSERLRDLFVHTAEANTTVDDVALLRIGRHIRVGPELKVVLGRDRDENGRLTAFESAERWAVEAVDYAGPSAIVCGEASEGHLAEAVALMLRHAKPPGESAAVRWRWRGVEHRRPVRSFVSDVAREAPSAIA
jgi:hypothetical protein